MKFRTSRQFLSHLVSRRAARLLAAGVGLSFLLPTTSWHATASTLYWDQDGATSTATGGTGTWDLSGLSWRNGSFTGTLQAWTDTTGTGDIADFAGTAGTVTLGTNLGALGLTFDTTAYTLATSTNTLTLGASGITQNVAAATISGTGGLSLTAAQTWTVASGGLLTVSAPVNLNANSLTISGAGNQTVSGVASGTGSITKIGTGTLTLTGANTFSGGTNFGAGTVNVGSAGALGTSGTLSFTGGTLQYSAANTTDYSGRFSTAAGQLYNIDTNGQIVTYATALTSSGGSLTKLGGNQLILTAPNTYSGATMIGTAGSVASGGTLTIGTTGQINASSSCTVYGSGSVLSLDYTTGATTDRLKDSSPVTLNTSGEIKFTANGAANTSETIGTLGLGTGTGVVTLSEGAAFTETVTASGFSRGSNFATGLMRGTILGQTGTTNSLLQLTSTAGLTQIGTSTSSTGNASGTVKNLTIIPYLYGDTAAGGNGKNFVTYDTTSGFRVLIATNEQSLITAGVTGDNVKTAAGANALTSGAKAFNSLLVGAGTATTPATTAATMTGAGGASDSLTLTSGALMNVATGANGTGTISGFSSIIFGTTGANEAVITNANTNGAGTLTISSPINTFAAGGGLTKAGAGPLILTAANLYTGATTINAGTLQVGNGTTGSLAANGGTVTITPAGTLIINQPSGSTFANAIAATGTLTITNNGTETLSGGISGSLGISQGTANQTLILSGPDSYTGTTAVSAGTLTLSGVKTTTGSTSLSGGMLNVNSNAALSSGLLTLSGGVIDNTSGASITSQANNPAISITNGFAYGGTNSVNLGNGAITIISDRTITLNGNNTNTLTLGGILSLNRLNTGANLTVNNATGVSGETLVLGGINIAVAPNISAKDFIISGTGNIAVNGPVANGNLFANTFNITSTGTVTLAGTSTYTGVSTFQGAGGTVRLTGTLGSGGGTAITVSNGATLTETSTGSITGTSSLTINDATTVVTLGGTNTYSGTSKINAGTLNLNSVCALGSGAFNISGGTLDNTSGAPVTGQTNNPAITLGGNFAFGGTNNLNLGTGTVSNSADRTITINTSNAVLTFGGVLQNTNATGAFNIAVNNGTNATGGTVVFNNGYNIAASSDTGARTSVFSGSGNVIVNGVVANGGTKNNSLSYQGTGTLTLTGANAYTGGTNINAGGTVQLGTGGTTGSLSTTGAITDNGTFVVNRSNAISQATGFGTITGAGGVTLTGGGTTTFTNTNTYTGATTINNSTLNLDFNANGAPATNIISSSSALVMSSGTLNILAKSGTATSQTVNGLTLNLGASNITVSPATTNPNAVVLALGAITRNTGSTVVFTLPPGGQNSGYGITTSTSNFSATSSNSGGQGILGGYATTDLFNYATVSGGNIITYAGEQEYDNVAGFSNASGKDVTDGLGQSPGGYDGTSTNSVSLNSLRFNEGSNDSTININGGNTLTVASGGILVTPNLAQKYARINGGSLTTGSAQDLIVIQNNTAGGRLQIGSQITGTGGLTKAGVGQLDLNGSDANYTGATTVNGGTMLLTAATTATSNVTLNNTGTLLLGANDRVNDAATVILNGGTLNTGGFQEGRSTGTTAATAGLGALTLSTNSSLDFGSGHTGSSVLAFTNSASQVWNGTLTLLDFTPGTDFLNFGSSGLTSSQLGEIFYNGTAASGLDSFGNVLFSPVPEPATWAAGALLVAVAGWQFRRHTVRRTAS